MHPFTLALAVHIKAADDEAPLAAEIINKLLDWFGQIGDAFVNAISSIPTAIASIFEKWVESVTSTFGVAAPIGVVIVLAGVMLVMYVVYFIIDTFLM